MAFGIKRDELHRWKNAVKNGDIAFLTHYWMDKRFPGCYTVTKVGCADIAKLKEWGKQHGLQASWIDHDLNYPHFDLFGDLQKRILIEENQHEQLRRFRL
ncbi:MAG TPA: hypothetical protein VK111_02070 [Virgibacillus sp.]|nr:hypothetical protein [Virgibacillus sp.]